MNVKKLSFVPKPTSRARSFLNFPLGKVRLMILLLILVVPIVSANIECGDVFVVNFHYDNGVISYKDKVIKCGYAPDRRIQPEECYTAEMISIDGESLYSFDFCVPLNVNVDSSESGELSGGMVVLNETDFALIFPYYDEAKSITILNPRKYQVLEVPLIEEQFIQKRSFWWVFLLILVVLIGSYIVYKHYKNKQIVTKNL